MAKSGTWGDFICLKALSEILKVQFNLLILNTGTFQLISNNDMYSTLIPLGFIDDYHYTALVPIQPLPSVQPSVVPGSVSTTQKRPLTIVPATPSIAPQLPAPIFSKVKQLSSVNELLDIMDKVKPYVYDDISQLQKADRQIMVSLGM
jgi:hypothetical protein